MTEIIYKELSYKIVGCRFDVYNELGFGHKEKYYQTATEEALRKGSLGFERQLYVPIKFKEKVVGKYYLDLLVEEKIVVELKVGDHFFRKDIEQILSYLKSKGLKLGILINFTSSGVKYKRIINS